MPHALQTICGYPSTVDGVHPQVSLYAPARTLPASLHIIAGGGSRIDDGHDTGSVSTKASPKIGDVS